MVDEKSWTGELEMSEAEGVIFNRAVNFVLPHAIPTHLDRSEEYKLGDVLVYEKKLKAFMPWRRHRLVFTGVNISELLTEAIQIDTKVEDRFTEASTTRTFGESAKVDAEVAYAVAHFGAKIAESERATVSVDFGKVSRHYSNLSELLSRQAAEKKYQVSTNHPVIRDAITHDRTLFVINNLYVAEKADVSLIVTGDSTSTNPPPSSSSASSGTTSTTSGTTNTTNTTTNTSDPPPPPTTEAPPSGGGGLTIGGDVDVSFGKTGKSVANRDLPTTIAYRVIRFKLGSHGNLLPQLRSGIRHIKVRVMDETDSGDPLGVADTRNETSDKCEYTHDRFDIMAAREDEP